MWSQRISTIARPRASSRTLPRSAHYSCSWCMAQTRYRATPVALAQIELRRQHDDARPRIDRQPRVLFVRHARVGSPVAAEWDQYRLKALPRARGFTHPQPLRKPDVRGSPTRAWVHRSRRSPSPPWPRFPRARVGSPCCGEADAYEAEAPPRARGFTLEIPAPMLLGSACARGFTHDDESLDDFGVGSPTRAWVHRISGRRRRRTRGLPHA